MNPAPDLGALADLLLERMVADLESYGFTDPLVGDGVAPAGGGWVDGQPGSGLFRPYMALVSGGASLRTPNLGSTSPSWAVSWSLRSFGGSRAQCDMVATAVRRVFADCLHQRFGDPSWKIIGIDWGGLGATTRVDATSPPFWQAFDMAATVVDP